MNSQLHILLHVWNGLKLDADDFTALACAQGLPAAEQIKSLKSSRAREYFDCAPGWWTWSERQIELAHENGIGFCTILDADFPDGWRTLSTAPQVFTYIGRPIWKTRRLISVVGSRTPRGETCVWMQREFGEFLKNARDAGIVSGGARGVDQWAHRLSIDHDRPTLVVFPSGLLRRYPHNQDDL
ncbi:MAG TPA: DNA-processing protein DprA, partial [Bdellovibrionales bacterium]|nr:DNA-processing protein DprA [Bdellovibrionales bacterium]